MNKTGLVFKRVKNCPSFDPSISNITGSVNKKALIVVIANWLPIPELLSYCIRSLSKCNLQNKIFLVMIFRLLSCYQRSSSVSLLGTSSTLGFSMILAVLSPASTIPTIQLG